MLFSAVVRGKRAVSGFKVLQPLAGGTSALMEWRLQTGRTHQIRSVLLLAGPMVSSATLVLRHWLAERCTEMSESLVWHIQWVAVMARHGLTDCCLTW